MASLKFRCPHCRAESRLNRSLAGRTIRCPKCDVAVRIPDLAAEAIPVEGLRREGESGENATAVADPPIRVASAAGQAASAVQATSPAQDAAGPLEVSAADVLEPLQVSEVDRIAAGGEAVAVRPTVVRSSMAATATLVKPAAQTSTTLLEQPHEVVDVDEPVDLGPKPGGDTEMDMTPMVDVTFLLLIFFMITAAFSSEKALQQKTNPKDAQSVSIPDVVDELKIRVDEINSFLVMLPDQTEREANNKQDLLIALSEAKRDGQLEEVESVKVEAHQDSAYSAVIAVLDACAQHQLGNFSVKSVEEFD